MQLKPTAAHTATAIDAPTAALDAVQASGQPLDAPTREFMETRFGVDFSRVRIHADDVAAQAAHEVSARAYTLGHHVVFGEGEFAPRTVEGRRLIAHELAHVVQQTAPGGSPALQRDPKDKDAKAAPPAAPAAAPPTAPASQDVAVVLSKDAGLMTEARVLAPGATILQASSLDGLGAQLKTIKGPVKNLYFVSHMTEDGDLMFDTPGTQNYATAEQIADTVKGTLQVENINFQGCNIAQSPASMQKIAGALKATRAKGSTCTLVEQTSNPVMVNGKPILTPAQLDDRTVKKAFEAGFKQLHALFVDKRKKCILNDSVDGYFQAGGKLIAYWANPGSMADDDAWDDGKSICYRNLKVEKVDPKKKLPVIGPDDCKLIELEAKKP